MEEFLTLILPFRHGRVQESALHIRSQIGANRISVKVEAAVEFEKLFQLCAYILLRKSYLAWLVQ